MQIEKRFTVYPCDDGVQIIYDELNNVIFAKVTNKDVANEVCRELNFLPDLIEIENDMHCLN